MDNIFILIDAYSRECISSSFSVHDYTDLSVLNNYDDCLKLSPGSDCVIIVFKPSIRNKDIVPQIRLVSKLYGFRTIILTDEPEVDSLINYGSNVTIVHSNLKDLDYHYFIQIVNNDTMTVVKKEVGFDINAHVARCVLATEDLKDLHDLASEFLIYKKVLLELNQEITSLRKRSSMLQSNNEQLLDSNKSLTSLLTSMITQSVEVNNALTEYEVILSNDVFPKISLNEFTKAPTILYLKHQHHLQNLEQLIDTLVDTVENQERMSVKVLRLFDSKGSKDIIALPDKYVKLGAKYLGSDVITNQFISKYGDYTKLLSMLLTNKIGLSYLIIVDCRSYSDTVLIGEFPVFNLCGDWNLISKLGLKEENTIYNLDSNITLPQNPLGWTYYKEQDTLQTESEKSAFLTSRSCIVTIIDSLRKFNRKV